MINGELNSFSARWSLFFLPKLESYAGLVIFELSNGIMLLKSSKKLSIQDQLLLLLSQLTNQTINPLILAAALVLVLAPVPPALMIEAKIDQDQDPTAIIFNIRNLNISALPVIKKIIFCEIALILKSFKNITRVSKINNNNKSLQNLLTMLIEI